MWIAKHKNYIFTTGVFILLVLPLAIKNSYYLGIINFIIIYSILCLGLNLILGYTGLLSIGHAAFYGIGSYTTAILMKQHGVGFLSSLVISAIITFIAGILIAIPTRKVKGDYFALITLAFGAIFMVTTQAWVSFTGGSMGIVGIPVPEIFGFMIRTETHFYYLGLVLLGFTLLTLTLLVKSRYGRAFIAIREDELAASVMGINAPLYKTIAFAIGSLYAGIAGSFFAVYQTTVTPSSFRIEESCLMIIMVIIGGMGALFAPFFGVVIMTLATEVFRPLAEYRMLIIGVIMVVVLLYRPQGVLGASAFKE